MNEERIARVEGEIEQLAKTLGALAKTVEVGFRDLNIRIESASNRSQPDVSKIFGLILQSAGCLIVFIAAVATPIAYHFNNAIQTLDTKLQKEYQLVNDTQKERQNSATSVVVELDARLQREFRLVNDTINERQNSIVRSLSELDSRLQREFNVANARAIETAQALSKRGEDAQVTINQRLEKVESWLTGNLKSDLDELRQWRLKAK